MKPVEYHPVAFDELIQSAEYYEARSEGLGECFLDEAEHAVADVSESPDRWPYFLLMRDDDYSTGFRIQLCM